nr:GspH/FimT family pseudopilin [Glaciecola sp. XM2]
MVYTKGIIVNSSTFAGQKGATLLELMIVVTLMAILLTAVIPSAADIIDKSRVTAQVNHISSVLQYTRYNAIDEHTSTSLCPTNNLRDCDFRDWNLPKMLFSDRNFNNIRDENEALIYATQKTGTGVSMTGPRRALRFYENGVIGSPATLVICPERDVPKLNRALFVSLQGRVRLSEDRNQDGIHEKGNGDPLVC